MVEHATDTLSAGSFVINMLAGAGCVDGSASFRSPAPPKISRTSRRCDRAALRCAATLAAQPHPSSVQTSGWTYKYPHYPCASPCGVDDVRCQQMEALFQNVLNYPRLPCRLVRLLDQMTLDVHTMTATVEGLTHQYGPEMVLYLLRKQPNILQYDLNALVRSVATRLPCLIREPSLVTDQEPNLKPAGLTSSVVPGPRLHVSFASITLAAHSLGFNAQVRNAEYVGAMLKLRRPDLFRVLTKNANLLCMEPQLVQMRYAGLHKVLGVDAELVRALVIKFPPILNCDTEVVGRRMDVLHQLASSRTQWQEDVEVISHNLLVFWLKDYIDLRARLEFLVAQKLSSSITLRMVFKTSNNTFARKYQGFREWKEEWKARRQAVASRRQAG